MEVYVFIMDQLISIIVPVYNVEEYLKECIDSILNQTYKNLEIILVNDGSTDKSGSICEDYAKVDSRIKVVHKKNGGLSDARNLGLDRALGEYVIFIDSDDYIDQRMCEILLNYANKYSVDIVSCNFKRVFENNIIEFNVPLFKEKIKIFTNDEVLEKYFLTLAPEIFATWNKLYKKSLFFTDEKIRFPVNRLHEDIATTYRLYAESKKVVLLNELLYNYRQRSNSIMKKISHKNIEDLIKNMKEYIAFANLKDFKYPVQIGLIKSYLIYSLWSKNIKDDKFLKCIGAMRELVLEYCKDLSSNPYIDKKIFIKFLLIKFNKNLLIKNILSFINFK